ncbi:MAG: hypothetical protein LBL57_06180, partial [Tannerella sp.]|nr:hypothetical protein [Tannerella sp.]
APVMPLLAKGLVHAVKDLCSTVPNVHFESLGTGARIEKPVKIILYRAVRELIGNAVKHALSSNIFVQVITGGRSISITVCDDGKGFDPATVATGAGLANMAIAVIACKGTVTIHSAPGKGTEINIKIEQRI